MLSPDDPPFLFPSAIVGGTSLLVRPDPDGRLPVIDWVGLRSGPNDPAAALDLAAAVQGRIGSPLLAEHWRATYRRPGLSGHRAGRAWSTAFTVTEGTVDETRMVIDAADPVAGLTLRTEVESLIGGALRIRHTLTNTADDDYTLDRLDVCLPLPMTAAEVLDFTGRHERERTPQRHEITDGVWLRENRHGRTGWESASVLVTGPSGFGFDHGAVTATHLAFSGNSALWVERDATGITTGGGELLLPGEIRLAPDEAYRTPWLFVVAADDGLDAVANALHAWVRSRPAHPARQPVVLNVWEAVYFDHDLGRLAALADRAARVGVERFVLDDGWFHGRRDDRAGLGDWWVDRAMWPDGLHPLIDHVRGLGLEFGLWFEPEMINPDSDLYRAHPDWILATGDRLPLTWRNQFVLDISKPEVWQHILAQVDGVLREHPVDFVKWDHNRDLVDAGSLPGGQPAVHAQALAHYALLDELRGRHPGIDWESCAGGGGRIDLGVLERVQRVWASDMTDARSRQQIQRWTVQLTPPEYLGAHVSATRSHQTGRVMTLDFRAATALFGAFGVEWDLTQASDAELDRLAEWIARHRRYRPLLHSGRTVRIDPGDPAVYLHGVVAADGRSALMAHVQLDEAASNRGVLLRVPHLDRDRRYRLRWEGPVDTHPMSFSPQVDPAGPTAGRPVSGAVLGDIGVWIPRRRPDTILLIDVQAE